MRRRMRGIVRNAVLWGIGWGALGFATTLAMSFTGVVSGIGVLDALGMGIRIGIVGGIAGAMFSSVISVLYRGRNIEDISAVNFGIGGAIVSAVGLPLFMQTASLLSGGGMVAWRYLGDDIAMFAAFGGVAAALSMKLAHIAARRDPVSVDSSLDDGGAGHLLRAGDVQVPVPQRAHSDARPL